MYRPGGDHERCHQRLSHPQREGERILPHDDEVDERKADGGVDSKTGRQNAHCYGTIKSNPITEQRVTGTVLVFWGNPSTFISLENI